MSSSLLQRVLLKLYGAVSATGLLNIRPVERVFGIMYQQYKLRLEAPYLPALRPFVRPGSTVVDVGANIGFFTLPFAAWSGPDGCVVAIEPEPVNHRRLEAAVRRGSSAGHIVLVQAAAQESAGTGFLAVDPVHPGNHRLAREGLAVEAVTVDALVARHRRGPVSLIKVDVQGAEARVLDGAMETIARWKPALFLELDDAALRVHGASALGLLDRLADLGYAPHVVSSRGVEATTRDAVRGASDEHRYTDVLFLPSAATDS